MKYKSHFISFQEAIVLISNMKLDRALSVQMSLQNNPIVELTQMERAASISRQGHEVL